MKKKARKPRIIVIGRGWHGDIHSGVAEKLTKWNGQRDVPEGERHTVNLMHEPRYEHEHLYELRLVEVLK